MPGAPRSPRSTCPRPRPRSRSRLHRPRRPGPGRARGWRAGRGILFEHDEPIEAEVLDDDAFFATLREAVRDDAPLGPREDQGDATVLLEGEEESDDRFGGLFKRRR
ncbi:MAG: hypothetical protein M5U14_07290 [Acidimicrobiia bacterium]|nr:hypothetical protein [Acidimicrobiia bacterium]